MAHGDVRQCSFKITKCAVSKIMAAEVSWLTFPKKMINRKSRKTIAAHLYY